MIEENKWGDAFDSVYNATFEISEGYAEGTYYEFTAGANYYKDVETKDGVTSVTESYMILEGERYYEYTKIEGEETWIRNKTSYVSCGAVFDSYPFASRRSDFNFDSDKKAYVCSSLPMDSCCPYTNIEISFLDGKLERVEFDMDEDYWESKVLTGNICHYIFSKFGTTTLEKPEKWRDSNRIEDEDAWGYAVEQLTNFTVTTSTSSEDASVVKNKEEVYKVDDGKLSYEATVATSDSSSGEEASGEDDVTKTSRLFSYGYEESEKWSEFVFFEDGEQYFVESVDEVPYFGVTLAFNALGLYDFLIYETKSDSYFCESYNDSTGEYSDIKLKFSSGLVSSLSFTYEDPSGVSYKVSLSEVGSTEVTLPEEKKKNVSYVSTRGWEKAFASATNYEYSSKSEAGAVMVVDKNEVAISVDDGAVYRKETNTTGYTGSESVTESEGYYGKENGQWYAYSSIGEGRYSKLPSENNPCSEAEAYLSSFKERYSDFSFNSETNAFELKDSITLTIGGNGIRLNAVSIGFSSGKLSSISFSYAVGMAYATVSFSNFGQASVSLPSGDALAEAYVTSSFWENEFQSSANYEFSWTTDSKETSLKRDGSAYYVKVTDTSEGSGGETASSSEEWYYEKDGDSWISYVSLGDGVYGKSDVLSSSMIDPTPYLTALASHFDSFSFSFDEGKYTCESLGVTVNGTDTTLLNPTAIFSKGKLVSFAFTEGTEKVAFSNFGETKVNLPSGEALDEAYVSESVWKALLTGRDNCEYSDYLSYEQGETVYTTGADHFCSENEVKVCSHVIQGSEEGEESDTETVTYYGKEEEQWYKYSSNGSGSYSKEEVDSSCVADPASSLASFASQYGSFAYDKERQAFVCDSLTLNAFGSEETFTNLIVRFSDGDLHSFYCEVGSGASKRSITLKNFGAVDIELPIVE